MHLETRVQVRSQKVGAMLCAARAPHAQACTSVACAAVDKAVQNELKYLGYKSIDNPDTPPYRCGEDGWVRSDPGMVLPTS
jgi:hypothetical protein